MGELTDGRHGLHVSKERVNVTLDSGVLQAIDRLSDGRDRSRLVEKALRRYLDGEASPAEQLAAVARRIVLADDELEGLEDDARQALRAFDRGRTWA